MLSLEHLHLSVEVNKTTLLFIVLICCILGARCSSVVRAFTHGAMGRQIDPSWFGPIELFLIAAKTPRLV